MSDLVHCVKLCTSYQILYIASNLAYPVKSRISCHFVHRLKFRTPCQINFIVSDIVSSCQILYTVSNRAHRVRLSTSCQILHIVSKLNNIMGILRPQSCRPSTCAFVRLQQAMATREELTMTFSEVLLPGGRFYDWRLAASIFFLIVGQSARLQLQSTL